MTPDFNNDKIGTTIYMNYELFFRGHRDAAPLRDPLGQIFKEVHMITLYASEELLFTPKHFIGTFTTLFIVAVLLFLTLIAFKKTEKSVVLKMATVFLLIMELFKQTLAIRDGGWYPLWALPLQLCSLSIYLMPLVAFGSPKVSAFFKPACFTIGMFASLAMLCYPSTVLGSTWSWLPLSENVYPLISFSYHGAMIFFSLFLILSKAYRPKVQDYPRAYLTMVGFAVLAILANAIFTTTDMMFLNTASGFPFQFILLRYGRLIYYLFMAVLSFLVLSIPYWPSLVAGIGRRKRPCDSQG